MALSSFAVFACIAGILAFKVQDSPDSVLVINLTNYYNSQYYGNFSLGSPPQNFTVVFATSSSGSWISSTDCTSPFCLLHENFNYTASSSVVLYPTENYDDLIFDRDIVGYLATDNARIGCSPLLKGFTFLLSDVVENYPVNSALYDGVIGLAASENYDGNFPTFIEFLYLQGLISQRTFSIYYSVSGNFQSMLIIGGYDSTLYSGNITSISNEGKGSVWQLNVTSITVAGFNVPMSTNTAVIDSSQTGLVFPSSMQAFLQKYTAVNNNCSNKLILPALVFTINGTAFTIGHDDYVIQVESEGSKSCSTTIYSNIGVDSSTIVLGDSFLKAYYSYYDLEAGLMSFAKAN
mmetsp:Transcript_13215/g.24737  ORF Transcript_13215/g.24737 Transcript_13215/m.24737 type:complete len:349 (+) Transcript_13215:363-1409(+)|eukprot:CAMPEP_0204904864 /NCGR_PEP_ID=MMETSP1397-20131031/5101_1 /ASSEMBLY_ACC=CAM_ASM_000891 /TAXON_ID=49980 /ORGANISM="Climacostomum Climacostomum virens, Strain Stock W-24" /LENGTH=348 /DNA_ID=CAMNT_0052073689 /DNA_START=146 /DNA_END=1192 /DNA_ORIENTATION=-